MGSSLDLRTSCAAESVLTGSDSAESGPARFDGPSVLQCSSDCAVFFLVPIVAACRRCAADPENWWNCPRCVAALRTGGPDLTSRSILAAAAAHGQTEIDTQQTQPACAGPMVVPMASALVLPGPAAEPRSPALKRARTELGDSGDVEGWSLCDWCDEGCAICNARRAEALAAETPAEAPAAAPVAVAPASPPAATPPGQSPPASPEATVRVMVTSNGTRAYRLSDDAGTQG